MIRSFLSFLKEQTQEPAVKTTHHEWYGRGNPVHKGHELGIGQTISAAKKDGGSHAAVFTSSFDGVGSETELKRRNSKRKSAKDNLPPEEKFKNPLTPEQKLKHVKRAFPGANPIVLSGSSPTLLHHVANLYKRGVRDYHLHVGSDRVDEFKSLLGKYKGVEGNHGFIGNDMKINIHAVGGERTEETPEAKPKEKDEGAVEAASATKMRRAAAENNRKKFHAMAPSKMKPEHKDEMFDDVRKGMGL